MSDTLHETAPLAETDISDLEGLTLEDLTRLHALEEDSPPPVSIDNEYVTSESAESAELAENPQAWVEEMQDNPSQRKLKSALLFESNHETYHLEQGDDIRRLAQRSQQLFQSSLPELMQSLSQRFHAQEQLNILYDRLSELSESRSGASQLLQTAKQIESMEKVLQEEQISSNDQHTVRQELALLTAVLQRYDQILAGLDQLEAPQA